MSKPDAPSIQYTNANKAWRKCAIKIVWLDDEIDTDIPIVFNSSRYSVLRCVTEHGEVLAESKEISLRVVQAMANNAWYYGANEVRHDYAIDSNERVYPLP